MQISDCGPEQRQSARARGADEPLVAEVVAVREHSIDADAADFAGATAPSGIGKPKVENVLRSWPLTAAVQRGLAKKDGHSLISIVGWLAPSTIADRAGVMALSEYGPLLLMALGAGMYFGSLLRLLESIFS